MEPRLLGGWIEGWIDRGPCRLRVPDGYRLLCLQGTLWLTCESRVAGTAVADLVLQAGDQWQMDGEASLIASALGGQPVRLAFALQAPRRNAGSTASASSSSMDACGRPLPARFSAT
ncbi:DUF2917 domain-containing protein [Cupriavidus sp. AU9028]|nr:DUF2917 domain-containing protein [Cupriavidus sp. AU9028]